jgi:hypothetical protein
MHAFAMKCLRRVVMSVVLMVVAFPALAWIYPEHRDIAVLSVESLDAGRQAEFNRWWAAARTGHESRLCDKGADAGQGLKPACIDWAALPAIAGDHSCSSVELVETVLDSNWILKVADVAARLKSDLAKVPVNATDDQALSGNLLIEIQRRYRSQAELAARVNALRSSDSRLQVADPGYATRAGANNAHFLLARPSVETDAAAYVENTLKVGSEINAIGVWAWFHQSALQKASRLAHEQLSAAQRQELALSMLADEAFALHFLEDAFASGHVAGTWGDASQRKGTHDFYNQNGLEVFRWARGSTSIVLMGDAYMRPQDAQVAASAVRTSLEQVLDTAAGRSGDNTFKHTPAAPATPDAFNVCKASTFPVREPGMESPPEALASSGVPVLRQTPIPALGAGLGSVPRFRSELGPFVGLASSVDVERVDGGYIPSQSDAGWVAGLDLSLRAGFGLEGVLGDAGDGLVFVSAGMRADTASSNNYSNTSAASQSGTLGAAIPARVGFSTRLRMPFYLIPGDLLILSPLYFISPKTYANMAVAAGNGGLIPWQTGWFTGIGRFQFVLGRELGVTFYGHLGDDTLLVPGTTPGAPNQIVQYTSTSFDLPVLEYRPFRAFAGNQSSAVLFQLFVAADVPKLGPVVSPVGGSVPDSRTVWSVGVRMVFDWRHYY